MAQSSSKTSRPSSGKAARRQQKADKAEQKAEKAGKKAEKKERRKQLWQVFKTQIKEDKRLLPYLIGTLIVCAAIVTGLTYLMGIAWWIGLVFGVAIGVMVAMIVFARRVQRSMYQQAEGQPGAAAWSLQNNLKGQWRVTQAVSATTHFDAVHRVLGRPGIVLVGEGSAHRVKPLLAQEKKRLARVVGATPIYDIIVGTGEGEVRLRKLNSALMHLPRNISAGQVGELDTKLASLRPKDPKQGLPKGPAPANAKMRSMQRMAKRRG